MAPLTPFIVTVTFEAGAAHRDFSERFETLSEASSYAEMARAMDDVRQIVKSTSGFPSVRRGTQWGALIRAPCKTRPKTPRRPPLGGSRWLFGAGWGR
jgi:hypothetical protein